MKKTALLILGLFPLLLLGCTGENSSETSSSSPSSSSSSVEKSWSEEQKALLEEYCGSPLPYPSGMMGSEIKFEVIEEESGSHYLQISDLSSKNRIAEYYKSLQDNGWNIHHRYDGSVFEVDSEGTQYVIANKKDEEKGKGYEIIYFHVKTTFTSAGIIPAGSVIRCYNDLDYKTSGADKWSESEEESIRDRLATSIPYIAIGENGYMDQRYSNAIILTDQYAEDLCSTYSKTLQEDGYLYIEEKSEENACYYLMKTLPDGAKVEVALSYLFGNTFFFIYTANPVVSTSWPAEFAKEIKEATGFEPPAFVSGESKSEFRTYKKNNTYYIEGDTYYDNPTWDYGSTLEKDYHLSQKELGGPYVDFNETINVTVNDLYDENNATIGMQIAVKKITPSSSFLASWPSEAIASTIKDILKVSDFSLPILENIPSYTDKNIKYSILGEEYVKERYEYYLSDITEFPAAYNGLPENYTEEDIKNLATALSTSEAGIKIEIEDKKPYLSAVAYEEVLNDACYYKEVSEDSSAVGFEDKDGKIGVSISTVDSNYGYGNTTIFIHGGSKKAHTPEFGFYQDSYKVNIGASLTPTLIKKMLPYDVEYSITSEVDGFSVNENGVVSVDTNVIEGSSAILTATLKANGITYSDSCTIVASVFDDYSAKGTMELVLGYLAKEGYEAPTMQDLSKSGLTYYGAELRFEDKEEAGVSLEVLKKLVEESLLPDNFELRVGENGAWSSVTNCELNGSGKEVGKGNWNDYYFVNQEGKDQVMLEFSIYTPFDNEKAIVLRIMSFDCLSSR